MLGACDEVVEPAEESVGDGHVGDKFPVVALQDAVRAEDVHQACAAGHRVDELQMQRAAPAHGLVAAVDLLLLVAEQEPVESHTDEVAHDGQCVEQVVSRLQVDRLLPALQGVLPEVYCVLGSLDARNQRRRRQHQRPVRKRNQEPVPVHIHKVGAIAHEY